MKTQRCLSLILSLFLAVEICLCGDKAAGKNSLQRPAGAPQATLLNINRFSAWYNANGEQERDPVNGNAGTVFPRGTATVIYAAGILWGGIFYDGQATITRVNGQVYEVGTKPGAILGLRTGVAENPAASDVRAWRVRRDYAAADLRQDVAEFFKIPLGQVTDSLVSIVRNQYALDWAEWPWQKGAPFYDTGYVGADGHTRIGAWNSTMDWGEDLDHNGTLDPGEDLNGNGALDGESPGIAGADQILWLVCNDIGVAEPFGCPETGMEEQVTIWGYNRSGAIGDAIFKRLRIIYKGLASSPADARITSMWIGHFSDPDVGDSGDDYAGCDTLRQLSYVFNGNPTDHIFDGLGLPPPAVGYTLLQGPIVPTGITADTGIFDFRRVPGSKNRAMTGSQYYTLWIYWSPPFSYAGTVEWYQALRGLPWTPSGPPDPPPLINPATGQPTAFWVSGDPVTGTGWLDSILDLPGDRQIFLSTGPFSMALGDTQETVVALVGGTGSTNINSITILRANTDSVRQFFSNLTGIVTEVQEQTATVPTSIALEQNYPNPFNPRTDIRFQISVVGMVKLKVFDLLGREVATLVNEKKEPGSYTVTWDAEGYSSGVYICTLTADSHFRSMKMLLVK